MQVQRQLLTKNDQIQQLTPNDGPTAIAFHYTQLKTLVKIFIQLDPTNQNFIQAWMQLNKQCQLDLIEVIDLYEHIYSLGQAKSAIQIYDELFRQLQQKINQSVSMLTLA